MDLDSGSLTSTLGSGGFEGWGTWEGTGAEKGRALLGEGWGWGWGAVLIISGVWGGEG